MYLYDRNNLPIDKILFKKCYDVKQNFIILFISLRNIIDICVSNKDF